MENILKKISESKIIPILRKIDPAKIDKIIEIFIRNEIRVVEITIDSLDASNIINRLKEYYGDSIIIGAGTILSVEDAKLAKKAKADFIFSLT